MIRLVSKVVGIVVTLVIATTAFGVLAYAGNQRQKVNLAHATFLAETMGISVNTVNYFKKLEEASKGLVKVTNYSYMSSMFGASDLIPACGRGAVDVIVTAPLYTPALVPLAPLTEMPYCTEKLGADAWAKAMLYETYEPYRKQYDKNNVKILAFVPSSPSSFGVRTIVDSLDACKGYRIRAYGAIAECIREAGMIPVQLSVSDVYTGMERGTIDGWSGLPLAGLEGSGLLEVSKTLIDPGFGMYGCCTIQMNMDLYQSLPQDVREWIERMRKEYVLEMANLEFSLNVKTAKLAKEKEIHIVIPSDEEKRLFKSRVNPEERIHRKYINQAEEKGLPGKETFDLYMKYVKEWEPKSPWRNPFDLVE
jgi:TRAP-type C4-dicarboxylate transport system substrate-binding protein